MKRFLSSLCATALTAAVGVTGALPANAGPVFLPMAPTVEHSDVIQIRDRSDYAGDGLIWKRRLNNNNFRQNNWNGNWNDNWNGKKYGNGWHNGYRGYPYQRRGYRYHNGFWFPAGAFIAGALIGGAIANNNTYYRGGGSSHVQWCYDRYRSYREWDNTWQPYNGGRRVCNSPYDGY